MSIKNNILNRVEYLTQELSKSSTRPTLYIIPNKTVFGLKLNLLVKQMVNQVKKKIQKKYLKKYKNEYISIH